MGIWAAEIRREHNRFGRSRRISLFGADRLSTANNMHTVEAAAGLLSGTPYSRKLSGPRNTDRALVSGGWWPQADSAARSPHAARLSLSLRVVSSVGEHTVRASKSGVTDPGGCAVRVDRTVRR